MKVKSESEVTQLCPTPSNPMDRSLPGSPTHGICQARVLEWVAISFSNAWKWKVKVKSLSCVRLLATPWTAAYQAPPSMGFARQEYWSRVPLPSPSFLFERMPFWTQNATFCFPLIAALELCFFIAQVISWKQTCPWLNLSSFVSTTLYFVWLHLPPGHWLSRTVHEKVWVLCKSFRICFRKALWS